MNSPLTIPIPVCPDVKQSTFNPDVREGYYWLLLLSRSHKEALEMFFSCFYERKTKYL